MKKLLLLAAVLLFASSCEENDKGLRQITDFVDVRANQWVFKDDYYTSSWKVDWMREYGQLSVYHYVNDVQVELPFVRHYWENVGGVIEEWTETIDYDFEDGWINFYVTFSDFNYTPSDPLEPGAKNFRLVLTY